MNQKEILENDTNKKFKDSILLIEQQRTENKNRAILTMSISTLLPVLFYALLSTILFCLIKIFRYVIYGFDKKEPKACENAANFAKFAHKKIQPWQKYLPVFKVQERPI